ncbi:MAG: hypothetical protein R3321_14335, partial [Nitrososphaeraceae archaeon]|nr:hypothetical protein [Nitrososphaeraceae archaeon]
MRGYDINSIRDFAVNVRKGNLTIQECTVGYRMQNILDMLSIDDEAQIITFLEDVYQLSTRLDLNPTVIQDDLLKLIKLSKDVMPSK